MSSDDDFLIVASFGCFTGDCPHDTVHECLKALESKFVAVVKESSLEETVQLVIDAGLSTGHAESHQELMREVLDQVKSLRLSLDAATADRFCFCGANISAGERCTCNDHNRP